MNSAATFLLAVALTAPPQPGPGARVSQAEIRTPCIISVIHEVKVPAMRAGVLVSLQQDLGDEVEKDAILARIDDRDAMARVRAAELRQHQSETTVASSRSFSSQLALAKNDVYDRKVKSPIQGVVAELFSHEGEWLQQGEPIMRIIQMDRVKAESYVSFDEILPFDIAGRRVSIELRLADGMTETFENCRLAFVSPEVEGGGRYRIWAEVANRHWYGSNQWILRPGMLAEMVIRPD